MYDSTPMAKGPKTQAEHLLIAEQFSNEMMDRFNPEQVNEVFHHMRQVFIERREMEISEAQKRLAYLQINMQDLVNEQQKHVKENI